MACPEDRDDQDEHPGDRSSALAHSEAFIREDDQALPKGLQLKESWIRAFGICGILAPILALVFIGVSIMIHPEFNFPDYALSHLGALDTPDHIIYNVGMVLTGCTGILFSCGVPGLVNTKIGVLGILVFASGFFSLALVGVFPGGTSPHNTVSMAFFTLSTFGILILALDQLLKSSTRLWGVLLMALIFLGVISAVLVGKIPHLGAAIPETIGAVAFSEFSIVFGLRLLKLL